MPQKKVALLTGVSSGIGRSTAMLLSKAGFEVFGTMRRQAEDNRQLAGVQVITLDVLDLQSVRSCVQTVLHGAGRIDVVVNNAGYTLIGVLEETSREEAMSLFETNFFGVVRMIHAVLPVMREQGYGRIVNIGSVAGFVPMPFQRFYSASKHALEGLSQSWDHEVREFGVRVTVIEPGFTKTDIDRNRQIASHPLPVYVSTRNSVLTALSKKVEKAKTPLTWLPLSEGGSKPLSPTAVSGWTSGEAG